MRASWLLPMAITCWLPVAGCGGSGGNGNGEGKYEMYVNDDLLGATQLTFLKGRCLSRITAKPKEDATHTALVALGELVAGSIPLDGSAPASDQALVALVPGPPLAGDLAGFEEDPVDQVDGPWLVTTDAFAWINGAGQPFEDAGFEAAAGEYYQKDPEGWELSLELVNMSSTGAAEQAFTDVGWNTGTRHE